ncbi:hypothetical protein K439DRAFT_1641317 [Ramaria rubella]|nr:hypothetical protein K439DRAFT_1641317 [Ramaria rubella]
MLGFHLLAPCCLPQSTHRLLISTSAHRCSAPPHHIPVLRLPPYPCQSTRPRQPQGPVVAHLPLAS